ncbi:MAG: DMT family transporter [Gordonibacter sp.]
MNRFQANICLICVTMCWSVEVILLKNIPTEIPAFAVVCMTNFIGALVLGAAFFARLKKMHLSRSLVLNASFLATLSVAFNVLATIGLRYLEVSTGTFAQMMTLVIVPLALFLLRRSVSPQRWAGIAIVIVGIFIALGPSVGSIDLLGITLVLSSCVIEAVYLIRLNACAKKADPMQLAVLLLALISLFSGIVWAVFDPWSIPALRLNAAALASLFMYSLFICAIAMALNIFAQKTAAVQDTIVIYALQIVFSTIFAATLPDLLLEPVPLTAFAVIGCSLVCIGNIVSEFDYQKYVKAVKAKRQLWLDKRGSQ